LRETVPAAVVDRATSLEEAQRIVSATSPDLFVLDVDAAPDFGQEFLYDLRTSHPKARAIILTAIHLAVARERAAALGGIHFLEKPFPHADFVELVQALLRSEDSVEEEKFQGTLSDLHMADVIQLKCMSGATAAVEFTGPDGEKGCVFFQNGQVRHATAPGKEGIAAFNEIVGWKGGRISELAAESQERTINLDWQVLLMEAMRKMDESRAGQGKTKATPKSRRRTVLVIDDSPMLLNFVRDILTEANYQTVAVGKASEGLAAAKADRPDLILLDYVLPDMKGNALARQLSQNPETAALPVVYMSAIGVDLETDRTACPNVIGFLNKPFTSDLLLKTVETHMPESPEEQPPAEAEPAPEPSANEEHTDAVVGAEESTVSSHERQSEPEPVQPAEWWSSPQPQTGWASPVATDYQPDAAFAQATETDFPDESVTGGSFFCGDTRFFSLNWALQTITKEKLTGELRLFWNKEPVDLLVQNGQVLLVTTRDPELYCSEAPITLVNVDSEKISEARQQQRDTGRPIFVTLAQGGQILHEPAGQLVQHYGQKLFAHLWTAERVRFRFEQKMLLPDYARELTPEGDVDHWELATLRLIQFQDLGAKANYEVNSIPAYTRDGYERVQNLRLTVAEAQFASQFNGVRSIAQIAKNLRLDLKFARLTLFRFLAMEIVECWPGSTATKPERKGLLQRAARSLGLGE
jgi:DNA-binding response OmpR family regulator